MPNTNPYESSHVNDTVTASIPGRSLSLWGRVGLYAFELFQALAGGLSLACLYAYLNESDANPSRYQYLFVPVYIWLMLIPVLAIAAWVYRFVHPRMSWWERTCFVCFLFLPTISVLLTFLLPAVAHLR